MPLTVTDADALYDGVFAHKTEYKDIQQAMVEEMLSLMGPTKHIKSFVPRSNTPPPPLASSYGLDYYPYQRGTILKPYEGFIPKRTWGTN